MHLVYKRTVEESPPSKDNTEFIVAKKNSNRNIVSLSVEEEDGRAEMRNVRTYKRSRR